MEASGFTKTDRLVMSAWATRWISKAFDFGRPVGWIVLFVICLFPSSHKRVWRVAP